MYCISITIYIFTSLLSYLQRYNFKPIQSAKKPCRFCKKSWIFCKKNCRFGEWKARRWRRL